MVGRRWSFVSVGKIAQLSVKQINLKMRIIATNLFIRQRNILRGKT